MRVVVADDSVLLREGLVRLLTEVDFQVVAAVQDAPSFLRAVEEHRPDVAIVDVRMPPSMTDDGLRAAVEARASQPDLGILMLSAYVELSYADVLLSDGRGRVGYLLKDRVTSLDTLVDAGPDGRRTQQCCDCETSGDHRRSSGEAHLQHLRQDQLARRRLRQPPRPGRTRLAARPLTAAECGSLGQALLWRAWPRSGSSWKSETG